MTDWLGGLCKATALLDPIFTIYYLSAVKRGKATDKTLAFYLG